MDRRSSWFPAFHIHMPDFAKLDQLVDIITAGVAEIKRAYTAADLPAPCLDEPWRPTPIDQQTDVHALLVSSAAAQLVATLRTPGQLLYETMYGVRIVGDVLSGARVEH
jgi:hypothetical protein